MHTQELLKKLDEFFSHSQIIVMYGLTESFRSCWLPPSETFKRPGSIGKPVPEVEIMVWNQQGQPCAPGEKGELVHRGAFITYGYLNNPDLTQEKFIPLQTGGPGCLPEMVVRSGDIVHMDEDGYLYFHGRGDMQIKCAGYRVSPGEVEEASLAYSGISQVAAFGLPHPELGQEVCLAYSTYKGKPVDHSALAAHLSASLPYYAVPKSIRFCAHLPLTAHGKIDYPALIKQAPDWENSGAGD
jgi:acyl-coenzyme A synthetase/AMP-(fatty) acid ligase